MPRTLVPLTPFRDFEDLRNLLDRVYATESSGGEQRTWTPAIDVERGEDTITVRADIPGVDASEVDIEVEDDVLTISGEHRAEHEARLGELVRKERRHGTFTRSMTLPAGVEPTKITAKTKDGVLEVTIPVPSRASKDRVKITPKATS